MSQSLRKLIGAVAMLIYLVVYALLAMVMAQAKPLREAGPAMQLLGYAILGLAWIGPMMPLVSWMERPDPRKRPASAVLKASGDVEPPTAIDQGEGRSR